MLTAAAAGRGGSAARAAATRPQRRAHLRGAGLPLSPAAQHLLLVGAAEETGDLATVVRGAAAAGIGLDALESAERAGLISVANGRLQFRHPLVRSAVYQHATFASRQGVHRDLAVVLEGTEDLDRRAWHLAAAAVEPDEGVAAELESSADRARRRSGTGAAADALQNGRRSSPEIAVSAAGGSPPLRRTPGSPASGTAPPPCLRRRSNSSRTRHNERG